MNCGTTNDVINAIANTMMFVNGVTKEEKPLVKDEDYFFVTDDSLCYDQFVFENYEELVKQGLKEEADLIQEISSNEDDPDFFTIEECWNRILDNFVYQDHYYLTYHGSRGEDLYAVKIGKSLPNFWECEDNFWN